MLAAHFFALITALAAPASPGGASAGAISKLDAIVATGATPAAAELTRPAVFIKYGAKGAVVGKLDAGPIA